MAGIWETLFPEGGANIDTTALAAVLAGLAGDEVEPIEVEAELPEWLPWMIGGLTIAVLLVAFKK